LPLPEEFQIKEYKESVQLLDDLRERVERGEVLSLLAVMELTDGTMAGVSTSTANVYALYGYLMSWGLLRMGFVHDEASKKSREEQR
jgi:hypothetical protein